MLYEYCNKLLIFAARLYELIVDMIDTGSAPDTQAF